MQAEGRAFDGLLADPISNDPGCLSRCMMTPTRPTLFPLPIMTTLLFPDLAWSSILPVLTSIAAVLLDTGGADGFVHCRRLPGKVVASVEIGRHFLTSIGHHDLAVRAQKRQIVHRLSLV